MMSTAMKVKSIIIMHQLFPLLINKFTARIHFNTREIGCDYRGRCSKIVDLSTSRIFKFHTTICLLTNRSSMLNFGEFHSNHRDQSRQPNCKQHKKISILNFFFKELTHWLADMVWNNSRKQILVKENKREYLYFIRDQALWQ